MKTIKTNCLCALLAAAALCSTLASCSGGHGVVSDDASDTSVFESESPSEHPSPSGDTSGVIDLPWEIPEDIDNPSQGLELVESYSKEFGDCYIVVGIGTCEDVDIVIPSTVNGIPVVEIADKAFYKNNKIKSVYCGNRVTKIGKSAFQECNHLKKVIIPDSVTTLCEQAFAVSGVEDVTMSNRITVMERAVFTECGSLKSIKLPLSLSVIPQSAFSSCSALTDVELPPNVVSIEDRAFSSTPLQSIRLPASVESINTTAFTAGFTKKSFQSFEVDEENPHFCSVDGVLYSKDMSTLIAYPQARGAYTVPDGVKKIETGAFIKVGYEVALPESIRTICSTAFFGEHNVNYTINIKKGVTYIEDFAFTSVDYRVTINFEGTKDEWNAIRKAEYWYAPHLGFGNQTTTVKCSDGNLTFEYKMQ